jgi:hypothetical protein
MRLAWCLVFGLRMGAELAALAAGEGVDGVAVNQQQDKRQQGPITVHITRLPSESGS